MYNLCIQIHTRLLGGKSRNCVHESHGVSWPSGLVRRICVLMAESSECEFESWLRPWCLCP